MTTFTDLTSELQAPTDAASIERWLKAELYRTLLCDIFAGTGRGVESRPSCHHDLLTVDVVQDDTGKP